MPSGLSQSHQEIAGQFQRELLQLICLGSGGQHVQRPPPRGMERPIGLQCPCNSFTRQEVRGASDSTNQRIENNALVSSSGFTGGARKAVCLVVSYSPVRHAPTPRNPPGAGPALPARPWPTSCRFCARVEAAGRQWHGHECVQMVGRVRCEASHRGQPV